MIGSDIDLYSIYSAKDNIKKNNLEDFIQGMINFNYLKFLKIN